MTCQKCGFQNSDSLKFCIECGSPLTYGSSDFYDTDEKSGYPEGAGYPEQAGYPERSASMGGTSQYGIVCNTYLPSGNDPKLLNMAREGWNWGAFLFTWIWLVCHNMVPFGIGLLLASFFFGPLSLIASFYLGAKGNELAWTYKPFRNLQHFEETERAWNRWGLGLFLVSLGGAFLVFIMAMLAGGH